MLERLGITVVTLPAISFRFKNLDNLRKCLERPTDFSGLLVTSGRTVDAIKQSVGDAELLNPWKVLRNYCVGQTTLKKIESDLGSGWTVRGGAETGNAEQLSELMLTELQESPCNLPFLFPCSNLALGTLASRLTTAGHLVDTIEVYETIPHPDLTAGVEKLDWESVEFILFFSPSTVQYFLDTVRRADLMKKLSRDSLKLIAIGPSTSQEMVTQGLTVFATCSKPNIESLVETIKSIV